MTDFMFYLYSLAICPACVFVGYLAGKNVEQDRLAPECERAWRYFNAVGDVEMWCGNEFPAVRLVTEHITAHGEGLGPINAGTPVGDEVCSVKGLREQLRRLSKEQS